MAGRTLAQGHFISKPASADDLQELLGERGLRVRGRAVRAAAG